MIDVKSLWSLTRESVSQWSDDYAASMGAALAYYTIFSIAPLIVIAVAVAGFFFGEDAARGEIFAQLRGLIGDEGATAIQGIVRSAGETGKGAFAAIAGIVTLLLGATTVFGELQSDLDRVWDSPKPKEAGLWGMLRGRLLSFGMVLGIGFLLLVSLMLSAALSALGHFWSGWFPGWELLLQAINFIVSFIVVTGLFAMIYKLLPRCHIGWKDVWIGATVTSLLFSIGKLLIGLYLGKSGVASSFGAAGSLVIVLLWVYYSSQIFLLGAEFTWVYAYRHGSRKGEVKPATKGAAPRQDQAGTRKGVGVPAATRAGAPSARDISFATYSADPDVPLPPASDSTAAPPAKAHAMPALSKVRIAAGIAATIGLLAGEILSELRRDRRRVARARG